VSDKPNVGDIIDVPYQEGECIVCGWVVTRDNADQEWTGQLGGDCRIDSGGRFPDGVHHVDSPVSKARQVRIAEMTITTVTLTHEGKVVYTQEVPAEGNWTEGLGTPLKFSEILVTHRKWRYHAAV
jgi:hypothetical protein